MVSAYNEELDRVSTKITSLNSQIANSSDPSAKATMEEDLAFLFEDLSFWTSEAEKETRKGFTAQESLSSKRGLDSSEESS